MYLRIDNNPLNAVGFVIVEQFQRSLLSCLLHSDIAKRTPFLTLDTTRGFDSHIRRCCDTNPGTPEQIVAFFFRSAVPTDAMFIQLKTDKGRNLMKNYNHDQETHERVYPKKTRKSRRRIAGEFEGIFPAML